ncbi:hypothetical protein M758_4G096100 [Ceratodon purpureus]|nr:hypothetical protein M758_4G096100 [Ceratodon purpureus]
MASHMLFSSFLPFWMLRSCGLLCRIRFRQTRTHIIICWKFQGFLLKGAF